MKHSVYLKILCILLPIAAIARVLQLKFTINPEDGFNFVKYDTLTTAINLGLFAVCALLLLMGVLLKKDKAVHTPAITGAAMGVSSYIMSFSLIADGAVELVFPAEKLTFTATLGCGLDIIMGIAFFVMAHKCISGKKASPTVPLMALVWSVVEMIVYYSSFNGIIMNTENIFNLMAMCTSMLFWLYFAHICAGYRLERSVGFIYGFGSVAALFCTLCTVPRIALYIMGDTQVLNTASTIDPVNIATLIFIVVYLIRLTPVFKSERLNPNPIKE